VGEVRRDPWWRRAAGLYETPINVGAIAHLREITQKWPWIISEVIDPFVGPDGTAATFFTTT